MVVSLHFSLPIKNLLLISSLLKWPWVHIPLPKLLHSSKLFALFVKLALILLTFSNINGAKGDRGTETSGRISSRTVLRPIKKKMNQNTKSLGNKNMRLCVRLRLGVKTTWENLHTHTHTHARTNIHARTIAAQPLASIAHARMRALKITTTVQNAQDQAKQEPLPVSLQTYLIFLFLQLVPYLHQTESHSSSFMLVTISS